MPANNLERLKRFKQWVENVNRNVYSGNPISAINEMLDDADWGWLHQNASSDPMYKPLGRMFQFLLVQRRVPKER